MVNELTRDIVHPLHDIRLSASMALATALSENTDLSPTIVDTLLQIYEDKLKVMDYDYDCIFCVSLIFRLHGVEFDFLGRPHRDFVILSLHIFSNFQ